MNTPQGIAQDRGFSVGMLAASAHCLCVKKWDTNTEKGQRIPGTPVSTPRQITAKAGVCARSGHLSSMEAAAQRDAYSEPGEGIILDPLILQTHRTKQAGKAPCSVLVCQSVRFRPASTFSMASTSGAAR